MRHEIEFQIKKCEGESVKVYKDRMKEIESEYKADIQNILSESQKIGVVDICAVQKVDVSMNCWVLPTLEVGVDEICDVQNVVVLKNCSVLQTCEDNSKCNFQKDLFQVDITNKDVENPLIKSMNPVPDIMNERVPALTDEEHLEILVPVKTFKGPNGLGPDLL